MQLTPLPSDAIAHLKALAAELGLPAFDLLLIGDGSGLLATHPAGWACLAYEPETEDVRIHAGAVTGGTNNFAELFPYVQALYQHQQAHARIKRFTPYTVIILSDSEVTVRCGSRQYARRANCFLWAAIDWFEQNNYSLRWLHVRRNSNTWSALMDTLAGQARRSMIDLQSLIQAALVTQPAPQRFDLHKGVQHITRS